MTGGDKAEIFILNHLKTLLFNKRPDDGANIYIITSLINYLLGNFRLGCQGIIINIKIHIFFLIQEMKLIILLLASTLRACQSTMFLMIAKIVVKNL